MTEVRISRETLDSLRQFDTPTICNAIELWDMRPRNSGYMNASIQACFPKLPPMVGFALTTTFRSMAPARAGDVYTGLSQQVECFDSMPGPPVMVFQDLDEPTISATFGEVMCSIYKAWGAAGIITSGAGRDLDQVEAIQFPAFTAGTISSHGYCHMLQLNVPVTVGGIWIDPGMLLHGDRNGVTTIPIEIASEIPDVCKEYARAEQFVLDYVRAGNVTPAGLIHARKECNDYLARISQKLRRR